MGRPHLSVMGVIYEALGFATARFGTVLRVAWLPLILLMLLEVVMSKVGMVPEGRALALPMIPEQGWITNLVQALAIVPFLPIPASQMALFLTLFAIAAILQTSYMVPLIRFAASGERPHHRSMHLTFGFRHLRFMLASALSFGVVVLLASKAAELGRRFLGGRIGDLFDSPPQAAFDEGSLHGLDTVESYEGLKTVLRAMDSQLREVGLAISTVDAVIVVPILLLALYVILRLLAWPYLVAVANGPRNAFASAWRLSGGGNIFGMFAIVFVYLLLITVTLYVSSLGIRLVFTHLFTGAEFVIAGYEGFVQDTGASSWIRGGIVTLFGATVLLINTFLVGFQAGLGGALVHRAQR